ncbi:helix-turn-helix domain-containing protein (plasmid) [Haloarcula salina]|uniref:helix-turn-helix domain-containing protein n=1 Tax=Haloarcula salina TaxID=1429914 RepID=UPI003C6F79E5
MVEFTIATERFELGQMISEKSGLDAELERIIPTEECVIPYVWVTGPPLQLDELQETLRQSDEVSSFTALDELVVNGTDKRQQLFRINWVLPELDIIRGIINADGAILEGQNTDGYWLLRFRFSDHEQVAQFYQYLTDENITDFQIDSIYELEARSERGKVFDLTPEQREAITLAAQRGYFSTPRKVTLTELGDELDISEQAFSQRLRRATEEVIHSALNIPHIEIE